MKLETLISSNAVISNPDIKSKKRALELAAEYLAEKATRINPVSEDAVDALDIFQLLTEREKLGSTGLGHGVALPHARSDLTARAIGTFLKLDKGIDFDSPDDQPTDLIFALLVPESCTDEHLEILAQLASMFSDDGFCSTLRNSGDELELYDILTHWQPDSQAS